MLQGRKFSFSIIVHADAQGPLINFHHSSPILNVRSDCPPGHLLEFLVSEGGVQASEAANEVHSTRAKEEALLERVRQVRTLRLVVFGDAAAVGWLAALSCVCAWWRDRPLRRCLRPSASSRFA